MFNFHKLALYVAVIMGLTCCTATAYAQDKPPAYVINMIVTRLIMQEPSSINTREISDLKITKEFISPHAGRYCLEVNYNRISDTGKTYPEHGIFFIEKKNNIWLGGKGGCD